jgi:hypothetical protein
MGSNTGEIILYQPDSTLQPEVRLESETGWLTQAQVKKLFLASCFSGVAQAVFGFYQQHLFG